MRYLLESPIPWLTAGAVCLTVAGMVFNVGRSRWALLAMGLVVLATCGGVLVERWVETPRESVQRATIELMAAVEGDDLPGVLQRIDPAAQRPRSDAQRLMPEFEIDQANVASDPEVFLEGEPPTAARAEFPAFVLAGHRQSGFTGGDTGRVTMHFRREGDRWLLTDYLAEGWRSGADRLRRGP